MWTFMKENGKLACNEDIWLAGVLVLVYKYDRI